jgi:hypothetical protein
MLALLASRKLFLSAQTQEAERCRRCGGPVRAQVAHRKDSRVTHQVLPAWNRKKVMSPITLKVFLLTDVPQAMDYAAKTTCETLSSNVPRQCVTFHCPASNGIRTS